MEAKPHPLRNKIKSYVFKMEANGHLLKTKLVAQLSRLQGFGSCFYTVFTVQAYQTSQYMAAFISASGTALSQEVADSKMNVQSACALNT
jgi:hypothetical protein